jgi:hypothetical protein
LTIIYRAHHCSWRARAAVTASCCSDAEVIEDPVLLQKIFWPHWLNLHKGT